METMKLAYNAQGLIPAIIQDDANGDVLMMAWMNPEALQLSLRSGEVHFWSRSRERIWRKGETSGNVLYIRRMFVDCDRDVLLVRVESPGPACHTGARSCFFRTLEDSDAVE